MRCDSEVTRVVVEGGRARRAYASATHEIRAGRAVLADVSAPLLYGGLVAADDLPPRVARGMRDFQLDPATVKVDWALDGPVPWARDARVRPRDGARRDVVRGDRRGPRPGRHRGSCPATRSCWPAR